MIGLVVLFNPELDFKKNIFSYLKYLDELLVFDNSPNSNIKYIPKSDKILYKHYPENRGLSASYNEAIVYALNKKYKFLLLMDQDSSFYNNDFHMMKRQILDDKKTSNIFLFSPMHSNNETLLLNKFPFFSLVTMNSGSVINLELINKIGKYDEKLFVDCVDTEFCLRAASLGFKIKRYYNIVINHHCGDVNKIMGVTLTNHTALRRYYIVKNRFYVWSKFPEFKDFILYEKKSTLKDLVKIIFFEKDKFNKIKMMITGYFHYLNNKFERNET